MKLSYATHTEVPITKGKISVVATNNPIVYRELVFGFQGRNDLLRIFDDTYDELNIATSIDWLGDVADAEFNVKKYVDAVSKTTMAKLNEADRIKTIAAIQDLYNVIQYDLFMVDLPLQVSMDLDLKKAINFCKVHFDTAVLNDPYGIIESVIKVHQECELGSYIALTNVAHYLDTRSFADLTSLVNDTGLSLVLIEFTELKAKSFYKNCEFTFIDQDFVDWQP